MFNSRRSPVVCNNGCVATSQPLASNIGLDILKAGGNAADASVAIAAALNVLEPASTGIGGDVFALFYSSKDKTIKGLNASGRSSHNTTLEKVNACGFNKNSPPPFTHGLQVTVPGAAAGWLDCVNTFGSGNLSMKDILKPAIDLARNGFPVTGPITSYLWNNGSPRLMSGNVHGVDLLVKDQDGTHRAPRTGEMFKNEKLANVFEALANHGKAGFYSGWIAKAIVAAVIEAGGLIDEDDLLKHENTFVDPISIRYKDTLLWELPPNGQGMVALETLNIIKNYPGFSEMPCNSADYLHILIEATKISFKDALTFCSDQTVCKSDYKSVLEKSYGEKQAHEINNKKANLSYYKDGVLEHSQDTVYFCVVDCDGNACSFINSTFHGFGSGIVPKNCGFALQNRGSGFSLEKGHPNVIAPSKRPYHTIIPAMLTDAHNDDLLMTFGVMGGFMQPQGHVQVILNMLNHGMNPQEALDSPRYFCGDGYKGPFHGLKIEDGIPNEVVEELKKRGHTDVVAPVCGLDRTMFGKGQVIALKPFWNAQYSKSHQDDGFGQVLYGGSDPRSDGNAVGY